jgi:aminoglycoside phosphotransferase (APT) family kinase protein
VVQEASGRLGLDVNGARPLRIHSNAVFVLPVPAVVARVGGGAEARRRAQNAVTVTRWLAGQGFPTVEPLDGDQPVEVDGTVLTFWRQVHIRPGAPPSARVLGGLLRGLHSIQGEPPPLQPLQPLLRLVAVVRTSPILNDLDRSWLLERSHELLEQYGNLEFPLGTPGLIHGDAQVSNLIASEDGRVLLSDWDAVANGPREWDLVVTAAEDRFGMSTEERSAFAEAYGYDVTGWPGWTVLRDLRELYALAAHIRRAPASPPHAAEMAWRIASLRAGDRRRWHAVG